MSIQGNDGILKPVERSRLETALAKCASCQPFIDALRRVGRPTQELQATIDGAENLARGLLEVDKMYQAGQNASQG